MKIHWRSLFIVVGLFTSTLFLSNDVKAAPYLASDILGQLTVQGDLDFNKNFSNNAQDNNARGFNSPYFTAVDQVNHRLFVADNWNHRVLVFELDANNQWLDRVADYVLGQPNFNTFNPQINQVGLNGPKGIAYDPLGNRLFVSDQNNHRIMVWDTATITNGESAINVLGQADFFSNGPFLSQSGLKNPNGLAFDTANNRLFVADTDNSRIMIFDVAAITDGENAVNVLGQPDFLTDLPALNQSSVNQVFDLAYDSSLNVLYASDQPNNRVMVFDVAVITDGENAINVLGQADFVSNGFATSQNGLNQPKGVSLDETAQHLFVADALNNRVMVFDVAAITDGENAINVLGQADFVSSGAATTQPGLDHPIGVSFNAGPDLLYVADSSNNRVMVFDVAAITDGENAVDVLGQLDDEDNPAYTTSNPMNGANVITTNSIGFDQPRASIVDPINHRIFVADTANNRVLIFDLDDSNNLLDHEADHVLGQPDFVSNTPNTSQDGMRTPTGLGLNDAGDILFVSDFDNSRVLVFDVSTITDGENAINVLGQPDFVSNNPNLNQSGMTFPAGLAYDAAKQILFVGDAFNGRVLVFDVSTITDGENAINVLGQPDFISTNPVATQSTMAIASSVLLDSERDFLFAADYFNNRVLVFDVSTITDGENAINVLGQPDFISDVPTTSQSGITNPLGLALDPETKRLFVSEQMNHRITIFDTTQITDGENAENVLGQTDYVSAAFGTTQSHFSLPFTVFLNINEGSKRLYVTELGNSRVMIFDLIQITTPLLSNGTEGVNYNQVVTTADGQGTLSFSLESGSLPPGLILDPVTGSITGTPTVDGNYNFIIRVQDMGDAGAFVDDQSYAMTIHNPPPNGGGGGGGGGGSDPDAQIKENSQTESDVFEGGVGQWDKMQHGTGKMQKIDQMASATPKGEAFTKEMGGNADSSTTETSSITTNEASLTTAPINQTETLFQLGESRLSPGRTTSVSETNPVSVFSNESGEIQPPAEALIGEIPAPSDVSKPRDASLNEVAPLFDTIIEPAEVKGKDNIWGEIFSLCSLIALLILVAGYLIWRSLLKPAYERKYLSKDAIRRKFYAFFSFFSALTSAVAYLLGQYCPMPWFAFVFLTSSVLYGYHFIQMLRKNKNQNETTL